MRREPPSAERHARWCERDLIVTYSISLKAAEGREMSLGRSSIIDNPIRFGKGLQRKLRFENQTGNFVEKNPEFREYPFYNLYKIKKMDKG